MSRFIVKSGAGLVLQGDWVFRNSAEIADEIDALTQTPDRIDATGIGIIDTSGAFLLTQLSQTHGQIQLTADKQTFMEFLHKTAPQENLAQKPRRAWLPRFMTRIGRGTMDGLALTKELMTFVGAVSVHLGQNIAKPRNFRMNAIVHQIELTGVNALPIVSLLAILISMVIFYQGAMQLQRFGADIFTIDLTVISLLREMAVLVTAIIVAGRSGSAFAAEIGVMKLREEIDAMRTMGLHPIEVLVIPRVIALLITLPLLTFIADMVGLIGGSVMAMTMLDIPLHQYIDRVDMVAKPTMFFVGMIKAPVFAFIIAIIGTYHGMAVSGSAEEVGKRTTIAVVQSIFLVIMADALFSILFAQMKI